MSEGAFAQNPTDIATFDADVGALFRGGPDVMNWSILIDDAFDHDRRRFPSIAGQINLYQTPSLEGLVSAAPRLIPLQVSDSGRALLRRALQHCSGRPMLSVVGSRSPMHEVKTHWESVHWISTEDGQELLLRFADTRVLSILPRVLRPDQWAVLVEPLQRWVYVDRSGRLRLCGAAPIIEKVEQTISLTNDQVDAFLAAAQPDAMLDYVLEYLSDAIPEGTEPLQCYHWALETCRLADVHGIEAWSDRIALFCAQALTRGELHSAPTLEGLLAAQDWPKGKLGQALVVNGLI